MTAPELPIGRSGETAVDVARACSAAAREIIRASIGNAEVSVKGRRNVVTEADFAVENAVKGIIASAFPDHAIMAEETAASGWSDGWLWIADPIDGTKNFARGIPHFGFSIALCHGGEPIVALTLHPLLGWEFLAVAGQGCMLNGEPVHVSGLGLSEAIAAVDLGYDGERGLEQLAIARALWPRVEGIRVAGSATLGFAYLAAGRWDLYLHAQLNPWDVAAGLLLVREAGGIVTEPDGTPATIHSVATVAGTPAAHAAYMALAADPGWRA